MDEEIIKNVIAKEGTDPAKLASELEYVQRLSAGIKNLWVELTQARKQFDEVSNRVMKTIESLRKTCSHYKIKHHTGGYEMDSYNECLICGDDKL